MKSQKTQNAPSPQHCLNILGAYEALRCGVGSTSGVQPITSPGRQPPDVLAPVHSVVTVPSRSQLGLPSLEPRFAGSLGLSGPCPSWVQGQDFSPCQTRPGDSGQSSTPRKDRQASGECNILPHRGLAGLGGALRAVSTLPALLRKGAGSPWPPDSPKVWGFIAEQCSLKWVRHKPLSSSLSEPVFFQVFDLKPAPL